MSENISSAIKKDPVLFISAILALVSCAFVPPTREYLDYINARVLVLLFCLMGIVAGMKEAGAFDVLSGALLKRIHSLKSLVFALTALCFFLSMFLTNDVALVTVVPFTILVFRNIEDACSPAKKTLCLALVLETIAANLGSMLTPVGNPQNLFLFANYNMNFRQFFLLTVPYVIISFAILVLLCFVFVKKGEIKSVAEGNAKASSEKIRKSFYIYLALFLTALLTVAKIIHWLPLLIAVCLAIFLQDKRLFARIDYSLLVTFVFFFIFVGNLGRIPALREFFERCVGGHEVLCSIFASQVISNVPSALLLSSFTKNGEALVIGTNLGGLGTIIASMASLITYKFCAANEKRRYLAIFSVMNFGILAVLYVFYLLIAANGR